MMSSKTKEQISYNMRQVKSKDSKIEMLLRAELWRRGFRYRKNAKGVTGKPDIAFIGKKVAVFCDSEFWHGFDWEQKKYEFKSRQDFWLPKIERNMERDREVNDTLKKAGWTVIRFWGHEIKRNVTQCADIIGKAIGKPNGKI